MLFANTNKEMKILKVNKNKSTIEREITRKGVLNYSKRIDVTQGVYRFLSTMTLT